MCIQILYTRLSSNIRGSHVCKLASAAHASMCKLMSESFARFVNLGVPSIRVHSNACTLTSVERASRMRDVASRRYHIMHNTSNLKEHLTSVHKIQH